MAQGKLCPGLPRLTRVKVRPGETRGPHVLREPPPPRLSSASFVPSAGGVRGGVSRRTGSRGTGCPPGWRALPGFGRDLAMGLLRWGSFAKPNTGRERAHRPDPPTPPTSHPSLPLTVPD